MRFRESTVLAPDGRPILIAADPAYRAAGTGRRFVSLPATIRLGPNAAALPHLDVLRARARTLFRNNPVLKGAIKKLVANLVGWGITPQPLHDNEGVRQDIATVWADWSKQIGLDAIQRQAAQECVVAGEVFIRVRPRRPDDRDRLGRRLVVPLELQVLEAEHVPVTEDRSLPGGGYVRGGIEFDAIGRRVAYWVYPAHPGDGGTGQIRSNQELRRVPASEVLHLYDPESPESIRGVPDLAPITLYAERLDQMHDATLERQAVAALFAGFIRRGEGATDPGVFGETASAPNPTLEPGTLSYLGEGEEITFPSLPDVGSTYTDFVRSMHLLLSAGLGMTYEQVSNDLSQVNYSSIRAGALEFRRGCQVWQYTTFCPQVLEPIYVHFLRRAQLAGAVNVPNLVTDEVRAGRVEWITQGWDWVDPLKEVDAALKEVQGGFETRTGVNIRRGNDPRRVVELRAAEVREANQLGLRFSSDVPEPTADAAGGASSDASAAEGDTMPDDEAPTPLRAAGGRRRG